jgi:hypothetical protein
VLVRGVVRCVGVWVRGVGEWVFAYCDAARVQTCAHHVYVE